MSDAASGSPDWLEVDGFRVPVWTSPTAAKTARIVVTSHGLTNDHRDAPLFEPLRNAFRKDSETMLVEFDYPGSGEADGELADKRFRLLRRALATVVSRAREVTGEGVPVAIVGRSIGGTIALSSFPDVRPSRLAVMSPPFALTRTLGPLRERRQADGLFPLPDWAAPSGQVKGAPALSEEFFGELDEEERRLRAAAATATNVLLVASSSDPKVSADDSAALWAQLSQQDGNERHLFEADHNYENVSELVVPLLVNWSYG